MFADPVAEQLATFVRSVGIDVRAATLDADTLFSGLDIRHGAVLVDATRLVHPGNILHEAGHIAVTDPAVRNAETLSPTGGEELATLAWSYAAALHLGFGAELVFYPGSYQGWDTSLIENFAAGRYIGVPLLQRYRMALDPKMASQSGVDPFPHMLRWVR
jgi:hypothetical protein